MPTTTTAKFSRRHYEFIAATIKNRVDNARQQPAGDASSLIYAMRVLASDFAREFSGDNPRFDAAKFLEACGL